jgi:indole-3-glycerol phosphate synthase
MVLQTIIEEKRKLISEEKKNFPRGEFREKASLRKTFSLKKSLLEKSFGIIAEIKRASPSAGVIEENLDIKKTALAYRSMNVSGISVLTCEPFFRGSTEDLKVVRENVDIPLLMKDFVIDSFQIYKGRASGADAILLILRILSDKDFLNFMDISEKLMMETVVEVHTKEELDRALSLVKNWDNSILGINNRNLNTLKTDLKTTLDLIKFVQGDKIVAISESGIKNREDIERLKDAGLKGALIGESLLKSGDVRGKLKELL